MPSHSPLAKRPTPLAMRVARIGVHEARGQAITATPMDHHFADRNALHFVGPGVADLVQID